MEPNQATSFETTFIDAARQNLSDYRRKIKHCLDQLTDEQIWQRPRPEMNSVANILLHLCGNLRQWIISAATGKPDVRNRPAEFSDRSMRSKADLFAEFSKVIDECDAALADLDLGALLEKRRIQGFDTVLLAAIFETVAHLRGHQQEIIHMTRAIVGPGYRFYFIPRGKEQGGQD